MNDWKKMSAAAAAIAMLVALSFAAAQGTPKAAVAKAAPAPARPKLIVVIVVDQMRGDYVDKFRGEWSGGLKRLLDEGAWFREAAYPYAATETCVGHATISTGSFPATHGIVANAWWDREAKKMVTCTSDPTVENIAYAGGRTKGGDSAWRMLQPSFAEELKDQTAGAARVVTFSLKARSAITLAGHKADVATWFDTSTGAWVTASPYGTMPFVEDFVKRQPAARDFGKTWKLSLPESAYLFAEKAIGAANVDGWTAGFPHPLNGKGNGSGPDQTFYGQWATSPFSNTYLTALADAAVDSMGLGQGKATDFLGVGYSSVDYVGHTFGPHSREIEDVLVRLDQDLGELFEHLDKKIGRGNYVVALSADHGVAPIPLEMAATGVDAGVLSLPEVKDRIEKAVKPFTDVKPAIARMAGNDIYFAPRVYGQLQQNSAANQAARDAASSVTGVAAVFESTDISSTSSTRSEMQKAFALSYFAGRSGDMFVLQKPYWLTSTSAEGSGAHTGTGHGTPYKYDQHVPIMLMGFGIKQGEYLGPVTPADIAPTFAALTGVTLSSSDGRVLARALKK
jgi:predicted AlkP superfamily pyrophosphatase or phosphodiesterase